MHQIVYFLDRKDTERKFRYLAQRVPEKKEIVTIDVDHGQIAFEVLSHSTYLSNRGEECHIVVRRAEGQDFNNFERHWNALCRDRK